MNPETSNKTHQTPETPETPETPQILKNQNRIAAALTRLSDRIWSLSESVRKRLEWPLEVEKIPEEFKTFLSENEYGPILTTYNGRVLLGNNRNNINERILDITRETDFLVIVKKEIRTWNKEKEKYEVYEWNWLKLSNLNKLNKHRLYDEIKRDKNAASVIFNINWEGDFYRYEYAAYQYKKYEEKWENNIREELNKKVKNYELSIRKNLCLYETKDENGGHILRGLQYNGKLQNLISSKSPIEIIDKGPDLYLIKTEEEFKLIKTRGDKSNCEILAASKSSIDINKVGSDLYVIKTKEVYKLIKTKGSSCETLDTGKSPMVINEIGSDLYVIETRQGSKLLKIEGFNCDILDEGEKIKRITYYDDKNGKSYLLNLIIVKKSDNNFNVYERKNHELKPKISWVTSVREWRGIGKDQKPSLKVEGPNGTEYLPYGEYRKDTEVIDSNDNLLILKYKVKNNKNVYYLVKEGSKDILLETENELKFLNDTNFIFEKTKNGQKVYFRDADPKKGNKAGLYQLWEFSDTECYPTDYKISNEPLVKPPKTTEHNPYFASRRKEPQKPFK